MRILPVLVAALLLAAGGCGQQQLDGTYGRRRGTPGGASVNGTAVLSEMFRRAGWKVVSRRFLSPKINDYDAIVWAPDNFALPDQATVDFLEAWLRSGQRRTLVFIGRDYDAEIRYWEAFVAAPPPDQATELVRRLARARATHAQRRAAMPQQEAHLWFTARRGAEKRAIGGSLGSGDGLTGRWAQQEPLQPAAFGMQIHGRLEPPPASARTGTRGGYRQEILLGSQEDILAYRLTDPAAPAGQVLVMVNGSFLLNLPLVHPEHRKLAGQLIGDCGPVGKVAFLESGPNGVQVLAQEPGNSYPTGLEAFTVWPLGGILWHFLAVGIFLLFARLVVFGRPQELPPAEVADFGRHVQALGELLATTADERFARQQLARYHESMRDAAGGRKGGFGGAGRPSGDGG